MTIESNLESIAKSLSIIAEHYGDPRQMSLSFGTVPAVPAPAPVPVQVAPPAALPVPAAPAPVPVPAAAPAAPVPAPVVPAPVPGPAAPFADAAGLMEYVKGKYRALGPIKGALIQNVLTEIGCRNINDVTPGNYGLFFQKVEAIV